MMAEQLLKAALHEWMDLFMRRSMRDLVLFARGSSLSMAQMGTLFHIHSKVVCSVSDIGDDLGTTRAAASQMLDRLVQQGFILRSEDPRDRRTRQIRLTDKGRQALLDSIHARLRWLDDLVSRLAPAEQQQVTDALHILITKANQQGAQYP
jgi:DNA-binding MarR family transcriptional regulator